MITTYAVKCSCDDTKLASQLAAQQKQVFVFSSARIDALQPKLDHVDVTYQATASMLDAAKVEFKDDAKELELIDKRTVEVIDDSNRRIEAALALTSCGRLASVNDDWSEVELQLTGTGKECLSDNAQVLAQVVTFLSYSFLILVFA